MSRSRGSSRAESFSMDDEGDIDDIMSASFSAAPPARSCGGGGYGGAPCAPPPPPQAKPAMAQVEGGSGGMGAVSFVVDKPADIK